MFSHIALTGLKDSKLFGYAKDVPFFKGRRRIDFKPGLNILVGPNGCGKSTVLKILGESLCATQGGVSAVTETAVHVGVDMMSGLALSRDRGKAKKPGMVDKLGLKVAHDGQPVVYCDPRQTVGLRGGAFDDDFFTAGVSEAMGRGSHGQTALRRAQGALGILTGDAPFPASIQRAMKADSVNDMWRQALGILETRFQPTVPLGQASVLLDEPESNYSIQWQARLWSILARPEVAQRYQVIVASHSAFALGIPHAHYLDLVPGFRSEAEQALRARFGGSVG